MSGTFLPMLREIASDHSIQTSNIHASDGTVTVFQLSHWEANQLKTNLINWSLPRGIVIVFKIRKQRDSEFYTFSATVFMEREEFLARVASLDPGELKEVAGIKQRLANAGTLSPATFFEHAQKGLKVEAKK